MQSGWFFFRIKMKPKNCLALRFWRHHEIGLFCSDFFIDDIRTVQYENTRRNQRASTCVKKRIKRKWGSGKTWKSWKNGDEKSVHCAQTSEQEIKNNKVKWDREILTYLRMSCQRINIICLLKIWSRFYETRHICYVLLPYTTVPSAEAAQKTISSAATLRISLCIILSYKIHQPPTPPRPFSKIHIKLVISYNARNN